MMIPMMTAKRSAVRVDVRDSRTPFHVWNQYLNGIVRLFGFLRVEVASNFADSPERYSVFLLFFLLEAEQAEHFGRSPSPAAVFACSASFPVSHTKPNSRTAEQAEQRAVRAAI
jgi:hypothetical protein